MTRQVRIALLTAAVASSLLAIAQNPEFRTRFRVKYVTTDAVYLEGGRNAGLSEGLVLVIPRGEKDAAVKVNVDGTIPPVAELKVVSVASTSAVCEVLSSTRNINPGDYANIPNEVADALAQQHALSGTRKYPAIVSFTEGDPLDEEVREYVPKPPLPEINRARGRFGIDYSTLRSSAGSSSQVGFVFRADITRIAGTYWNLSGYWRGRVANRSQSGQQTIQDLINRTYHLELNYNNPSSRWVAGAGRLYLPWATSLDTIDGGYIGRKIGTNSTAGVFAGTTPDPTSWSYNPNRQIAGSFVNFAGGSYENLRYTTTFGFGLSALSYRIDRPFAFSETGIFYKRVFSLYNSMQVDRPRSTIPGSTIGMGLSRSYLTVRIQPHPRLAFDLNHNYFRDIPTYDPTLVATGLVDKLLFQGFSGGVRAELPYRIALFTNIGRSNKTGDAKSSLNQMYGISFGHVPWTWGTRFELRYSKFDSAFGRGSYEALSLSRSFGENFRWQLEAGRQTFLSPLTRDTGSRFVNATGDFNLGRHTFMEFGFSAQRGLTQNYNQVFTTVGYRFDSREKKQQ